jgi:hypothetical protein
MVPIENYTVKKATIILFESYLSPSKSKMGIYYLIIIKFAIIMLNAF